MMTFSISGRHEVTLTFRLDTRDPMCVPNIVEIAEQALQVTYITIDHHDVQVTVDGYTNNPPSKLASILYSSKVKHLIVRAVYCTNSTLADMLDDPNNPRATLPKPE